ncbi:MAG TPA: hypothetical protein VHB30_04990, partial [Solirubrobacteraceae bacterium]|nr:hypothetical protein [Solirubrobacteraceae bacterium]
LVLGGQRALAILPRARQNGAAVLYVHGYGEDQAAAITALDKRDVVAALLRAGYVVAGSDAHGRASWGNRASVEDYLALVRWLHRRGLRRIVVLAQSMGGLAGLRIVDDVRPAAWIGIFPVCDLRALYELGEYAASIRAAFGGSFPHESHLSPVVPARLAGLPMLFFASPADTEVPKATNTDACAAAYRARGARVTVVPTAGRHGDPSSFQPDRVLAFLGAAERAAAPY